LPFKTNAARRHHIPKQKHRVTDWAAYDAGPRACGSLTVWVTPEAVEAWRAEPRTGRGGVHLRCIAERGRMGRQRASGYGRRALVESDISRWKRVIGVGLRFRTDGRQATEVAIAADVLNRMLDLGRPNYVRTA
jgi:hypothetical protein